MTNLTWDEVPAKRFSLPDETDKAGEASSQAGETTPGGQETVRWVSVATTMGPLRAEVLRGRLEAEGIPALVIREAAGGIYAVTVGLLGEADVLVPEELAERAREILGEDIEEEPPRDEEDESSLPE